MPARKRESHSTKECHMLTRVSKTIPVNEDGALYISPCNHRYRKWYPAKMGGSHRQHRSWKQYPADKGALNFSGRLLALIPWVSKTIPNKQWNNTLVRIGIENNTLLKEGQPLHNGALCANMGIENDTRQWGWDYIYRHIITGVENDTRQKEGQPLNKETSCVNMGIENDTHP